MARQFELLRVGGSPRQIGLAIGTELREKVWQAVEQIFEYELIFYKWQTVGAYPDLGDLSRDRLLAATRDFLPHLEAYAPAMVEELRGIAEGARISFEEALMLQIRGEIVYALTPSDFVAVSPTAAAPVACTAFAISGTRTRDGQTIVGQNWDYAIDLDRGIMHLLHVTPDDGPRRLMLTYAGLTSFIGINSAGVANFLNSLPWGWCQVGIPHYPVCWRIYQERDLAGARRVLEATDTVQAENHLLADGSGAYGDAELTPEGVNWSDDRDGYLVHTNHYLTEPYASNPRLAPSVADSVTRRERLSSLITDHDGEIDLSLMHRFLTDHEGYPTSICRHEQMPDGTPEGPKIGWTAASLIAIPERGVMYVCVGNPCQGEYVEYQV